VLPSARRNIFTVASFSIAWDYRREKAKIFCRWSALTEKLSNVTDSFTQVLPDMAIYINMLNW